MTRWLVKGGRVVLPGSVDRIQDVLIENGVVTAIDYRGDGLGVETLNAAGCVVCPGFIDIHTHLREPGFEHKETIATGARAAAGGGFTTVCCMPNTNPAIDSASVVAFVLER